VVSMFDFFFFQAEDGIRDDLVTGVQTCALPICRNVTLWPRLGPKQSRPLRATGLRMPPHPDLSTSWIRTERPFPTRAISSSRVRSEERRVGKECRSRWSPYH